MTTDTPQFLPTIPVTIEPRYFGLIFRLLDGVALSRDSPFLMKQFRDRLSFLEKTFKSYNGPFPFMIAQSKEDAIYLIKFCQELEITFAQFEICKTEMELEEKKKRIVSLRESRMV